MDYKRDERFETVEIVSFACVNFAVAVFHLVSIPLNWPFFLELHPEVWICSIIEIVCWIIVGIIALTALCMKKSLSFVDVFDYTIYLHIVIQIVLAIIFLYVVIKVYLHDAGDWHTAALEDMSGTYETTTTMRYHYEILYTWFLFARIFLLPYYVWALRVATLISDTVTGARTSKIQFRFTSFRIRLAQGYEDDDDESDNENPEYCVFCTPKVWLITLGCWHLLGVIIYIVRYALLGNDSTYSLVIHIFTSFIMCLLACLCWVAVYTEKPAVMYSYLASYALAWTTDLIYFIIVCVALYKGSTEEVLTFFEWMKPDTPSNSTTTVSTAVSTALDDDSPVEDTVLDAHAQFLRILHTWYFALIVFYGLVGFFALRQGRAFLAKKME